MQKRHWILVPLFVFILTRSLVIFSAQWGQNTSSIALEDIGYEEAWKLEGFASVWMRWDSVWYMRIIEDGYWVIPGEPSTVSWFPVYPMLAKAGAPMFGNPLVAGVILSNVCFLLALIVLYQLTLLEFKDRGTAARAVFYIAAFPTSIFFSAFYTESLFLLLSLTVAYYARQQKWGIATLAGIVASASRLPGFLLLVIVGMEWMATSGWTLRTMFQREAWRNLSQSVKAQPTRVMMIALLPAGLLFYMGYLTLMFGSPLVFLQSTGSHGHTFGGPLATIAYDLPRFLNNTMPYGYNFPLDMFAFVLVLLLIIPIARRLRESYAVYSFLSVMLPMWSGTSRSMMRYVVVLFPVFMLLGLWGRNKVLDILIKVISIAVLLIYAFGWGQWYFMG
jgi:hypothetical protein